MTHRFEIKRSNTILYCRRWAETVRFYQDQLGLEIAHRSDWLVEFRLRESTYLSVADASRTTIPSAGGRGITLSFQVDNLTGLHRDLIMAGQAPTPIRSQVMGADVFYLFDPEGNRLEFWSPGS